MYGLEMVHFLRDVDDGFHALSEALRKMRNSVGFFLKDKGREKGYYLSWLISRKNIVKNELGKNELIGRMDLKMYQLHQEKKFIH